MIDNRFAILPNGLFYLDEVAEAIPFRALYATADNFTGGVVDGYTANRVVVTRALADALCTARDKAALQGYKLLVWDAVRPQRAVDHFVRWSQLPEDNRTKAQYYPNLSKNALFQSGYIAARSGHSRGCAVDLTLTYADGAPLDMGGGFDLMDTRSWHGAREISPETAENRLLLKKLMEARGFLAYEREWWHYSLANEPYPDQYFDFEITK